MVPPSGIRALDRDDLGRVGDIDRTEHIAVLYEQRGTDLVERRGDWSASAWDPEGSGPHSVEAQRRALMAFAAAGGVALGAFEGERLVAIGMVVPHIRPAVARLAYLHVSREHRSTGLGGRLCAELESIARDVGDTEMVVTATPSEQTVRFYLRHGYSPMAEPLPELFEEEPDDVHLLKRL